MWLNCAVQLRFRLIARLTCVTTLHVLRKALFTHRTATPNALTHGTGRYRPVSSDTVRCRPATYMQIICYSRNLRLRAFTN